MDVREFITDALMYDLACSGAYSGALDEPLTFRERQELAEAGYIASSFWEVVDMFCKRYSISLAELEREALGYREPKQIPPLPFF